MKVKSCGFNLSEGLHAQMKQLCDETGVSLSEAIRRALIETYNLKESERRDALDELIEARKR